MKNFRSELARLRRLIEAKAEAARPKEIFRHLTVFEGVPLSTKQLRDLEYNHALKKPERVGFSEIRIRRQTDVRRISDVQQAPAFDN
jgi:hypothetical protein